MRGSVVVVGVQFLCRIEEALDLRVGSCSGRAQVALTFSTQLLISS